MVKIARMQENIVTMLAKPVRRLAYQPPNQSHIIPFFRVSYLVSTEARYLEERRSIHDDAGDTSPARRSTFKLAVPDLALTMPA